MNLASIICEYIYGAFQIVKTAIDAVVGLFETAIDKLYSIATTTNLMIQQTLSRALDAILLVIVNTLESVVGGLNDGIGGGWKWCQNTFKCNFFLEQVLDPDSLIAKTIRKILEGKNDCFCVSNDGGMTLNQATNEYSPVRNIQEVLFQIATDYESFKAQICNGLSLDMAIDMATDLCFDYNMQLNKWRRKFQSLIVYLKRQLQNLLDRMRDSKLFKLLEELKGFFECIIDSELCANIDTAKSFYQSVLRKLGLVEAGANEWLLSPDIEQEILALPKGFLAKVNEVTKKLNGIINKLANPTGVKGASNALDLTTTIKGVVSLTKDTINGEDLDFKKIPIIKYGVDRKNQLKEAWNRYNECNGKTTNDPNMALKSNKCATLDDALLATQAEGEATEYLLVPEGTDVSHAQELIPVGDKMFTVADAARQIHDGTGDRELLNFIHEVQSLLNVNDIMVRYA